MAPFPSLCSLGLVGYYDMHDPKQGTHVQCIFQTRVANDVLFY